MTTNLLLPHRLKLVGWCLFIPATLFGLILSLTDFVNFQYSTKVFAIFNEEFMGKLEFFKWIETDITPTIVAVLFIVGAMFVGFSKEKREDEFIAKLRLSSLLWAVWVNYSLLFISFLFVFGMAFINVMMYNMFTVLIIFIFRFNYILYRNAKAVTDEK